MKSLLLTLSVLTLAAQASRYLVLNDIHLTLQETPYEIPMAGEKCNKKLLQTMLQKA